MIDGHVHLERGPLSREYVFEFVNEAVNKGIEEIQILDHTHRFIEFKDMYKDMINHGGKQKEWLEHDFRNSLDEYDSLIQECKQINFPIKVDFGLEVCFEEKNISFLKEIFSKRKYDFLIGSVHSMFNIAYDSSWSKEELWEKYSTDLIYKEYFKQSYALIESDLFSQIGHPDTIKMFNYHPSFNVLPYYEKLGRLANKHRVKVENNTGCHYRYNLPDVGLAKEVLKVFKDNNCEMITVSDAHSPKDCGNYIKDIFEITMK